mmetsp:Transcript_20066/g.26509  ORF Transcript_20066/g.26509 Transcript_20066/m.26509 type:complete len:128 (+) Transcript_20066:1571-1954(+)
MASLNKFTDGSDSEVMNQKYEAPSKEFFTFIFVVLYGSTMYDHGYTSKLSIFGYSLVTEISKVSGSEADLLVIKYMIINEQKIAAKMKITADINFLLQKHSLEYVILLPLLKCASSICFFCRRRLRF